MLFVTYSIQLLQRLRQQRNPSRVCRLQPWMTCTSHSELCRWRGASR